MNNIFSKKTKIENNTMDSMAGLDNSLKDEYFDAANVHQENDAIEVDERDLLKWQEYFLIWIITSTVNYILEKKKI